MAAAVGVFLALLALRVLSVVVWWFELRAAHPEADRG